MAKDKIKGITVAVGGDTTGLQKALTDVNKKSGQLNSELRQVENALKLDPTNTVLLAQKQEILAEQVKNTSAKLNELKNVQAKVEERYKNGEIGADAYRAFQREVVSTESRLSSLKTEQDKLNKSTDETAENTEGLAKEENKLKNVAEETADNTEDLSKTQNALNNSTEDVTDITDDLTEKEKCLEKQNDKTKESTKKLNVSLEGLKDTAKKAGAVIETVAKSVTAVMTAAGAGIVVAGKAATTVGSDFESSVSQLAATMGKTTDEITSLSDKAKELGSTTQFSASQAADGLNILAMAGLNAEQQTEAIGTVLNLAAAGSLSLEQAASYTAGAVKGFGDEMANAQKYADLMAKGATLANTDVNGLGAALSLASATAKSYSQDAEGVTLSLLRLAEQNITGEQAATMLSRAMTDLYTPTDAAKKALKELGVSAYDPVTHKARDFTVITDELNKKLSGMTEEQANAYKATIFTTNGLNGFNKMMASSPEKVEAFKNGLADAAGSAENQAKTMIDNLQGDITIMQSAAEGLGITFYETFNDDLRNAVQFATSGISELTDAFKNGGLQEAALTAGEFIADLANKAVEQAPKLVNVASTLVNSIGNAVAENSASIADSAGKLVTSFATAFTSNTRVILNAVIDVMDSVLSTLPNILPNIIKSASGFISSIVKFLSDGVKAIAKSLPDIIKTLGNSLGTQLPVLIDSVLSSINSLADAVLPMLPEILLTTITAVMQIVTGLLTKSLPELITTVITVVNGIIQAFPQIIAILSAQLPIIIEGVLSALLSQIPTLLTGVFALVTAILNELPEIIDLICGMIPKLITALVDMTVTFLPQIVECGITLFTALIEGLPTIINSIVEKIPEIIDSIIGALLDALPLLIDCGVELFLALIENLPIIMMKLEECIPQIIEGIVKAIIELFPVIYSVGMDLFMSLVTKLPEVITKLANRMPEIVTGLTNKLNEHIYKMKEIGKNLVEGIWSGIANAKQWIIDKISDWCDSVTDSIKVFFGIHSPSTRFEDEIGVNLGLGVGEGFEDSMDDVKKQMSQSLSDTLDLGLYSGDSRLQTYNAVSPLQTVTNNSPVINFTLQIDNFNNTNSTSLSTLNDTIETTLYDLIRRKKLGAC